ncbi:hypothetical protein [Acinetobacter sp. DSM 11652]|uniref:hypothetical protein n=1 Tax=Acinetobacter sp. DSM 11652 TaxID=346222 RepID=UPI0008C23A66|nr:hypothetical protein [Acinetobacter sp. DSM 11652]SEM10960.1 hypothetical protein SAMN05216500_11172 [Acinetobacter sp. DSM 11652]
MIKENNVINSCSRGNRSDYLGLTLIVLILPFKLVTDILAYLFNLSIPSGTILSFPILLLIFFFFPLKVSKINKKPKLILIFFFSFFLLSIVFNFIIHHFSRLNLVIFNLFLSSFCMFFLYFFSGIYYIKFNETLNSIFFFIILIITSVILYTQFFLKNVWEQLNEYGAYLRVADVYAFILLFIIPNLKYKILKFGLFFLGILSLLYIGSRSSLIFYLMSFFLFFICGLFGLKIKVASVFSSLILFLSLIIFLTSLTKNYIFDYFADTRIGYTFTSSSGGDGARDDFFNSGLERIYANPLTGNIYSRLHEDEGGGNYIHNFLFLLDDYGVFVFLPFIFLVVWTLKRGLSEKKHFYLLLPLIFCLLSMSFSRAYAFPYFFFLLGIYISLKPQKNI